KRRRNGSRCRTPRRRNTSSTTRRSPIAPGRTSLGSRVRSATHSSIASWDFRRRLNADLGGPPLGVHSRTLAHAMSSAHRLIVVGLSRIGFAAIERSMDGDGGAHKAALPSEQVLRWVAGVVGEMRVLSVENSSRSTHRPSGTFRLRVEGTSTGATDLILKLSVPRWITDGMVITNARALRLAETHGLAGPRLIAADLDGRASGTVATLETFLSGSS